HWLAAAGAGAGGGGGGGPLPLFLGPPPRPPRGAPPPRGRPCPPPRPGAPPPRPAPPAGGGAGAPRGGGGRFRGPPARAGPPAAGTLAGALVVSAKSQALLREVAGGQATPGTLWLSLLPAAGGLGVGWSGWVSAPWLATGAPNAIVPLAIALAAAALLLAAV